MATDEDKAKAIKTLHEIAGEIKGAWEDWDLHIQKGCQPVPIQDLDYWQDQITRAVKQLE
jgi:hypothetical protein